MIILRKAFCRLNPVKFGTDDTIVDVKKLTYKPSKKL